MKRSNITGLVATVALAAALGGCSPAPQQSALISVTASAQAQSTPDIATINAGVESRGATAKAAQAAQATRMTAVVAALKAQRVDDKDIQTSQVGLNPIVDYSETGQQRITGYSSVNTVTITVRDLEKVSAIIDAIVADGGNRIDGIAFSMDDAGKAEAEAHAEAIRKARTRAQGYAAGAGMKVHRLVSIVEPGGTAGPVYPEMAMRSMSAEAVATPIMPGQVTTGAAVTVVFELR